MLELSMQLSPLQAYSAIVNVDSDLASNDLFMPLADVHNLLGKQSIPHTPPSPSTLGENPTGTPKRNKRRRMDIEKPESHF